MDFEKLISLIKKRQDVLNDELNSNNEEVEFFDRVVTNNNFSLVSSLIKINYLDVMTAYLCSFSNDMRFDEVYKLLSENKILIHPGIEDDIMMILFNLIESNKVYEDDILDGILKVISDDTELEDININSLNKLCRCYGEKIIEIVGIMQIINKINENVLYGRERIDEMSSEYNVRVSSKKKSQIIREAIVQEYDINEINKILSVIEKHYINIRSYDKKRKKDLRKTVVNYDELLRIINSFNLRMIVNLSNFDNVVGLIDDDEILKEFIGQVNVGLSEYFNKVNNEYIKLSMNGEVNIKAILKKFGISFNKLSSNVKDKIFEMDLEYLEEFLEYIKLLNISDLKLVSYILENSNLDIVKSFINLIKDGVLTLEFVLGNKEFLSCDKNSSKGYNSLMEKINLFKVLGINSRIFSTDLDIYLNDIDVLKYNFVILQQYNFLNGLNKVSKFNFLKSKDLENKIDMFLELGYERYLEEDLDVLNVDIFNIRKLYLLKQSNMLPNNLSSLKQVLGDKDFLSYVDDSYIFDVVKRRIDFGLVEDKNVSSGDVILANYPNRVIDVDGVLLSVNRIRRNYLKFGDTDLSLDDKLLYSLVYGSLLSVDEYDVVSSNISNVRKKL